MNVKDLEQAFYRENHQRYDIAAPNIYIGDCEMDIIGIRKSGYIDEIEIKISKSDYLADFKKSMRVKDGFVQRGPHQWPNYADKLKHDVIKDGQHKCNYFSFLMSQELAEKCAIPEYAGLYIYKTNKSGDGRVVEVKPAPLLHKGKATIELKYSVGRKMAFRYWQTKGFC